jgi:hypothetical protein
MIHNGLYIPISFIGMYIYTEREKAHLIGRLNRTPGEGLEPPT